ncbi:MAG: YbdD/YjiX family protein [Gemmatimonadota bacterium]
MSEHTVDSTLLQRCAAVVRKIIGAPDYDTYLAHMTARHPDQTPMTPRDFERARLIDRYSRPGSRCC